MPPETRASRARSSDSAARHKAKALTATIASSPPPAPPTSATPAADATSTESTGGGGGAGSSPPTVLFEDADAFERWLEENPGDTVGLWLQIGKKGCEAAAIKYDEALDVALCHGWIDGQRRRAPDDGSSFFLQRFTPRRRRSLWSRRNVAKVAALRAAGRMRPAGEAEVDAAVADGRWARAYSSSGSGGAGAEVPVDFQAALDADAAAAAFFAGLGRARRYPFLWRIETAKREETRRRTIARFVGMLARHETL